MQAKQGHIHALGGGEFRIHSATGSVFVDSDEVLNQRTEALEVELAESIGQALAAGLGMVPSWAVGMSGTRETQQTLHEAVVECLERDDTFALLLAILARPDDEGAQALRESIVKAYVRSNTPHLFEARGLDDVFGG